MGVVQPVEVRRVTVPPCLAPSMVAGPCRVGSMPLPVLPRFSVSTVLDAPPLLLLLSSPPPPQAASARRLAVGTATADLFRRMPFSPFVGTATATSSTSVNDDSSGRTPRAPSHRGGP